MHTKQLREWINLFEAVDSNYLYHSTQDAATTKAILNSGYFKAGDSPQIATNAQTGGMPSISFGRDLRYQLGGQTQNRDYQVVFVIDRAKLEQRYKTIATSQSSDVRGLAWYASNSTEFRQQNLPQTQRLMQARRKVPFGMLDLNKDGKIDPSEKAQAVDPKLYTNWAASKAGGEFEEVVPVKSGRLPWKPFLIGFYLVPGKPASQDPELLAHPLRLEMPRPNVFTKANPGTAT